MLRPAVCNDGAVVSHDEVLVAKTGSSHVDAARMDVQHVVEPRRHEVTAERLEHECLEPPVAQRLVAAGVLSQILDAGNFEPDEVRRVVGDALCVGVREANAHGRRERVTLHRASLARVLRLDSHSKRAIGSV